MTTAVLSGSRIHQWGGIAFVFGNLLFLMNKLDEMSRLFLGRPMPDVISGEEALLILIGQVALIFGYVTYYQYYAGRMSGAGKTALRLFSGGGIIVAIGHVTFISDLGELLPSWLLPYAEILFFLVVFGLLFMLIGLIWFGILNLRQPLLSRWAWLPLVTALMGFIGFFLFSGEEITAFFLFFRTLFALGLMALGAVLALEKPLQPQMERLYS